MARGSGGYGWTAKEIGSDVPPGKGQLAKALQRICRQLTPQDLDKTAEYGPTQAQVARHINVSETSLSRFLSGQSVPRLETLEHLYKTACSDAGGEGSLGISITKLTELHERANADHCDSCVTLRAEVDTLARLLQHQEDKCAHLEQAAARDASETDSLRREVVALRAEADDLRASVTSLKESRAGLEGRLAARTNAAPLPVPRRRGDRQRSERNEMAARNVARQASELRSGGRQGSALPLLHHTTEALSHTEIATLLCLLRQQEQGELADNLIHIYGRDQSHQDVVHVAVELHERGAQEDAAALLQVRATLE